MNKKAFTLLELLVVAVVIGVIAAMLLPALGRAREGARKAQCANNLRQIGIALYMYCDDHDDLIPIKLESAGVGDEDQWHIAIAPYLEIDLSGLTEAERNEKARSAEVYRCPTPQKWYDDEFERWVSRETKTIGFNMNMLLGPYDTGSGWTSPIRLSRVNNPSQTIAIVDCTKAYAEHWYSWNGGYDSSNGDLLVSDRHSVGANVLWVDGHVSWHLKTKIVNTPEWWYP